MATIWVYSGRNPDKMHDVTANNVEPTVKVKGNWFSTLAVSLLHHTKIGAIFLRPNRLTDVCAPRKK